MNTRSKSGRSLLCAAALVAAATGLVAAGRSLTVPYLPVAPDFRSKGPADAPIVIAEFSDFQCGGCNAGRGQLQKIQNMFPGKIRLVFKHLPWNFHQWGKSAAVSAECAGVQGRFWELHDKLFDSQSIWAQLEDPAAVKKMFLGFGAELALDQSAFAACVENGTTVDAVDADAKEAGEHFINVTPTFFINGKRFSGGNMLKAYGLNHIEDLLRK